ncbi:LIM domain only protein 3-like [Brevipalpus obovatus]|uniref:LIM domain only protein 3-like n=1 Tax=Brevipalpus obovatus TaxID=246614 RepID=UPI003D9F112A
MMERKISNNQTINSLMGKGGLPSCSGCHKSIKEQYLLQALNKLWHENCLLCSACNGRLAEMSNTFYTKADLLLCKRDYLRLFGRTGNCSACHKDIPSFELVMRARGNSYHLDCFACHHCTTRFCVGDRFYLHEDKILCEEDFKEISSRHPQLDHLANSVVHSNCTKKSEPNANRDPAMAHPTHLNNQMTNTQRSYSCHDG